MEVAMEKIQIYALLVVLVVVELLAKEPRLIVPHRGCYVLGTTVHDLSSSEFKLSDLKPTLCTYFVYGYGTVQDSELQITAKDEENLRVLNLARAVNPTVNIILALQDIDGKLSNDISTSFLNLQTRTDFVSTVVEKLRLWNLDGFLLNITSLDYAASNIMSLLIKDLHAKFDQENHSNRPRLILAVHVGDDAKESRIDPAVLAKLPDIVEVHTFDYHNPATEPSQTGHNAPLYMTSIPGSHPKTVEHSLSSWETAGIPKSKLVLTIALFGNGWSLIKMNRFEAGAPAKGATPVIGESNEEGRIFYRDICKLVHQGNLTRIFDTDNMVPYAHDNETIWISYDDEDSAKIKARWLLEKAFGGITFFHLGMEDYDGRCGKDSFSLLQAVNDIFETAAVVTSQEKRDCDRKFCLSRGIGVFALNWCSDAYCNCDYGGKAYKFRCGPGTIFDPLILACNYATAVKGCET